MGWRRWRREPGRMRCTLGVPCRGFGVGGWLGKTDERRVALVGPMYHSAQNAYGLYAARIGGNVILEPRFEAEELLQLIERERTTHIHMVPIMFNRLLKLPEDVKRKYDLSSLRFIVHAAAPDSESVKRQMIAWWGPEIHEY